MVSFKIYFSEIIGFERYKIKFLGSYVKRLSYL